MTLAILLDQKYTYGHYRQWPQAERWELIEGVPHAMTAPSRRHQETVFELAGQIRNQLLEADCNGYVAPFDVRLPEGTETDDRIETVVQPDLLVVCDPDKLDDQGCRGAPDWIIEVTAPSTAVTDLNRKRDLYQHHGVREYWIVHPLEHWVMVYLLDAAGAYGKPQVFSMEAPVAVQCLPGIVIDWERVSG
ncbi:MAG: Uma2 family endonuclease [Thiothrix sp.]|nr:Uma2 family endonuclease [Thiothrix sp.]HPQ97513.1 Uma2 family endonuclease [Thiolinea sp.]